MVKQNKDDTQPSVFGRGKFKKMRSTVITYSLADHDFNRTKSIGIYNVATQLVENLTRHASFEKFIVLANSSLHGRLSLPPHIVLQNHDEAISSRVGRALWDQWGLYDKVGKGYDGWLFLPKGYAPFLKPSSFKLAVYAHDAIHEFYRINYPGFMPWLEREYFAECLKNSLRYSKVIFTNSDFTKDELKRLAGAHDIRLPSVITAGIGFTRQKEQRLTKRNSLLLLTSEWPHKLTKKAIGFVERWQRETGFSGEVDLVGGLPADARLPTIAGWKHHRRLPEMEYGQLLTQARALLFFSAYEGFGMPPVEAMVAGTCPIFSNLPATRETMGKRGFSFSNDSYESFTRSLNNALSVSEAQIGIWAGQLLERHSWNKVVGNISRGLAEADR